MRLHSARAVNGCPDGCWAGRHGARPTLFYAWWLLTWPDFSDALGRSLSLLALAVELVRLDAEYRARRQEAPWFVADAASLAGGDDGAA